MPDLTPTFLLALLLAPGALFSQSITAQAPFRLDADAARFAGSDSLSYVEIYYGVSEGSLTYSRTPAGYRGALTMRISVADSVRTIASREWVLPRLIGDTAILRNPKNILSFESLALPDGAYRVTLLARDSLNPARTDSAVLPLRLSHLSGRTALSDIELCSRVTPSTDRSSPFYKNTVEVIPNPARLFGEGLPVVHFYVEVYNLDRTTGPPALLRATIRDSHGRDVVSQAKPKPRNSPSSVEYGSMNVGALPGGSYVFRISLEDTSSAAAGPLAAVEKKFFVYGAVASPMPGPGSAPAYDRAFPVMTEEEADDEIRKVRYISSVVEQKQVEKLPDLEAKRNFLKNFWSGRGAAVPPGAPEPRDAYLRKVREADEKYSERTMKGWLTDRGRVSILYGAPDNVERHPSTPESRPYEIWQYESIQGGVVFVFVDRLGFGTYRLVHSTHLNELRDDDWYQREAEIR
jgi:GWxTD domain-containing protein